jgi:hypothetical protein
VGSNVATTGNGYGVFGKCASKDGIGIEGYNSSISSPDPLYFAPGVYARTDAPGGFALFSIANDASATQSVAVYGEANGSTSVGVVGTGNNQAAAIPAAGAGGYFIGSTYGTYSSATGTAASNYGVYSSATGVGTTNYGAYFSASGASANDIAIAAVSSDGGTNANDVAEITNSSTTGFSGLWFKDGSVKPYLGWIGSVNSSASGGWAGGKSALQIGSASTAPIVFNCDATGNAAGYASTDIPAAYQVCYMSYTNTYACTGNVSMYHLYYHNAATYDIINDLNAIDNIKPLKEKDKVTGEPIVTSRSESMPKGFVKMSADSIPEPMVSMSDMIGLSMGGVRQLRAETKTRDEMLEARIERLEKIVEQLSGQKRGEFEFIASATAYKDIEYWVIVDARISKESKIIINGLSGYEIVNQDEGSFGIKFTTPPSSDIKFTYSAKF